MSEIDQSNEVEPDGSAHLAQYLEVCRRRRWLIVGLAGTFTSLVAIWSFYQTPIYQAAAGVVIEPSDPLALQTGDKERWSESLFDVKVQTHVNLITTHPILAETAQRLRLSEQPEYQPRPSSIKETLRHLQPDWFRGITTWARDIRKRLKELVTSASTEMAVQADRSMSGQLAPQVEVNTVKRFRKRVKIDNLKGSKLLQVTVESEDPVLAARAANTLVTVYIDKTLEVKTRTARSAAQWFTSHLDDLRNKVENSEQALHAYRSVNDLVNITDQRSIAAQKLADSSTELVQAETARSEAQTRYQQIKEIQGNFLSESKGESGDQAASDSLTEVLASPVIVDLRTREVALSADVARLSEKYGPRHPKMIHAQAQLRELRVGIGKEIDRIYRAAKNGYQLSLAREKAVRERLARHKAEKMLLDKHAMQYSILERDAISNRQLYDLFLKQMRETSLSTEIKSSNMYLAEPAIPNPIPVRPRKLVNTILGLVAGLALGIGFAFFLEYWDQTLRGPQDVERYLAGLLFLGWVPRLPRARMQSLARIVEVEPFSAAANSYRHIRTSVWLATQGQQSTSLVITSPGEHEGKTTLAVNLAIAMAQLEDHRVVVIDADLHRPSIGKIFGIKEGKDKAKGLMQYLMGDAELGEILHQTNTPNLAVIPAGGTPPNPTELLHSKQMAALIKSCSQQGLHVIVDAPPVLPIVDPTVIASLVSGTVLVVSAGETNRDAARVAIEHLEGRGAQILGVVMQKVSPQRVPHYYYGKGGYCRSRLPQEYRHQFIADG